MKQTHTERIPRRAARLSALLGAGYWFFALIYWELMLHIEAFGTPDLRFFYTLGFSFVFACALALITSFLPQKLHFIAALLLTVLLTVLYGSQMVYNFVFGTLYSVAQMQMGGDAVTTFWRETLLAMRDNILWLLSLFIPLILLLLLRKPCKPAFTPTNWLWRVILVLSAVLIQLISLSCLGIGGNGYFSDYYFYHSSTTTPDQAAKRFGLLTAFRLDLFGSVQPDEADEPAYYIPEVTAAPTNAPEATISTLPSESETVPPTEPEYNVLNIDFDMLNTMTEQKKLLAINDYCASLTGTNKNAYTGMLSDYNLIYICAESFSTAAIDPEITPTLYRMANEGILFNNFYNTFPNNTIDGEYSFCMGLYPDTSRDQNSNSFLASRLGYLPFCLGNSFQEQRGVQCYGYHNNKRDYYSRGASHHNMGYTMKFNGSGMSFTTSWPTSDYEMMQQSVDDYIGQDQFHAYYMTFSGHLRYDTSVNLIARRNYDTVAELTYSEPAKCYLSCHVELEKALAYLMQRLDEAGVADRTAIVLVGDHFPYGLTDAQYSELVGYSVDEFSKYKSSLLFWVGGLEENIVVDEYCCNVDILPTVLNLWGFDYDSRMLAGTDVFSEGEHIAVRIDKSFYTDKVWLNASTGQIRYLVDESQLPENYIENIVKTIETKFSISADILNYHYYSFVFEDGSAAVNPTQAEEPTAD